VESFAETPEGLLFVANGFDPVQRWDGLTGQMEAVGLTAPTVAPVMAKSGTGAIVGDYYAYLRYVDRFGLVSNLSPISNLLTISAASGNVTGATNKTPIRITTEAAHGLSSGATVKISGVGGNTAANGTWTITVKSSTTFDLRRSSGNGTYTGSGEWQSGAGTITFSSLQVPTDSKVVRRQILRNTDGQTTTFYVDLDTTDLTSTSLTSTKDDDTLSARTSQALLGLNGNALANRHNIPPNHKAVLAHHLNRMFLFVEKEYSQGMAKVTFGSTTVTGVGTKWTSSMASRVLYIVGATRSYTISSVNSTAQTLTLSSAYQDPTDEFAAYAIFSAPAERKTLYWSEANLPESWPPVNAATIQEDGDEGTGLMPMRSFLYILERRHIYKLSFAEDPALDGEIYLAANRGCINNRCWVQVDDVAYMLDEFGVHKFVGNAESEHLSTPVQPLFGTDQEDSPWKINWRASEYFHAVLYRPQETIRWFVTLSGMGTPRHALVYNYRLQRWWLEEYPEPIGGSCLGQVSNVTEMFLGGASKKVYAFWKRTTDIVNPGAGTVRGTVTSSGVLSITDTQATFPTCLNAPLAIVHGTGKGQVRKIVAQSGTTLTVDQPWLVRPDTTSVYQIGGISWKFKTGWFRLSHAPEMEDRQLEIAFGPTVDPAIMDMRLFYNFQATAEYQQVRHSKDSGGGIETIKNDPILSIHMDNDDTGLVVHKLPGTREHLSRGKKFSQVELSGVTNKDEVIVRQLQYDGVQ